MAGHRVLVLDTKNQNPNRYSAIGLRHAFASLPQVDQSAMATYRDAFDVAEAMRPTLLLAFGGEEIDSFLLSRLVRYADISAMWFTEDPYELPRNLISARLVDLVFTNDPYSVEKYARGHYLPMAGFEAFHRRPIDAGGRRYDLFFCGTAWPNRIEMFRQLMKLDQNLRVKLFSPPSPLGQFDNNLGPNASVLPINISGMDFARFIAKSVATLYLNRDFGGSHATTYSPNTRFFEAAIAGGVQVYPAGTLEPPEDFVDGENVFSFRSLEELAEIVNRLRQDTDLWTRAAQRSQRAGLAKHTFVQRAARILEMLQ